MREKERDLPAQRVVRNVGDGVHQGKESGPLLYEFNREMPRA